MSTLAVHFSGASPSTYYGMVRLRAYQLLLDLKANLGGEKAEGFFKQLSKGYLEVVCGTDCFNELLLETLSDAKDEKRFEKAHQLACFMKENQVTYRTSTQIFYLACCNELKKEIDKEVLSELASTIKSTISSYREVDNLEIVTLLERLG